MKPEHNNPLQVLYDTIADIDRCWVFSKANLRIYGIVVGLQHLDEETAQITNQLFSEVENEYLNYLHCKFTAMREPTKTNSKVKAKVDIPFRTGVTIPAGATGTVAGQYFPGDNSMLLVNWDMDGTGKNRGCDINALEFLTEDSPQSLYYDPGAIAEAEGGSYKVTEIIEVLQTVDAEFIDSDDLWEIITLHKRV